MSNRKYLWKPGNQEGNRSEEGDLKGGGIVELREKEVKKVNVWMERFREGRRQGAAEMRVWDRRMFIREMENKETT